RAGPDNGREANRVADRRALGCPRDVSMEVKTAPTDGRLALSLGLWIFYVELGSRLLRYIVPQPLREETGRPVPPPANGPLIHAKDACDFILAEPLIETQFDQPAVLVRELLHRLVKGGPPLQVAQVFGDRESVQRRSVGPVRHAVVMGSMVKWTGIMARQVKQFAANGRGCEPEEPGDRIRAHFAESSQQSGEGVLKNVPGLLPPADVREVLQHLVGEGLQALGGPP